MRDTGLVDPRSLYAVLDCTSIRQRRASDQLFWPSEATR